MSPIVTLFQRELRSYFSTPVAYVFIVIFLLMAGAFLTIGSCLSAAIRSQAVAYILCVVVCFLLLLAGFPLVLNVFRAVAPAGLVDAIVGLSFLTHFNSISKGVIDLRDLIYFLMSIGFWLYANTVVIDLNKAD